MQDPVVVIAGRGLINLLANALHLCEIKWSALDWGDLASGDAILCRWDVMVPRGSAQFYSAAVLVHVWSVCIAKEVRHHCILTSCRPRRWCMTCTKQEPLSAVSQPLCILKHRLESCEHGLHP